MEQLLQITSLKSPVPAGEEQKKLNLQKEQVSKSQSLSSSARCGRREIFIAGAALPLVLAQPSNPARALIQTGMERDSQKQTQSAIDRLQSRVSTFKLPNGMKWVVLERHTAPIITCHTYADVGAADESPGTTGIAHLLEHLAFKGTQIIGSRNPKVESAALDHLDEIFYSLRDAKKGGSNPDMVARLEQEFKRAQEQAAQLSSANDYGSLIERQGGIGLNARTSQDSTEYFVSLPANKLELWIALESQRFMFPVFRDLYAEKEVVKEERRLRVDNSPYGRFMQAFGEVAFPGKAYGRPIIGYPDDFESIGRKEVTDFFTTNYTPCNLTCAIVGDVDPVQVEKLANRYFGGWRTPCSSSGSSAEIAKFWRSKDGWDTAGKPTRDTVFVMESPASPLYVEGYYRPASWSSDDPVVSVIADVLMAGRVSRFYKRLIAPGRLLSAECVATFPGDKYPCMSLIYGAPPAGAGSVRDVADILHGELEDLVSRGVDESELVPSKKATRASLLEALGSNSTMASILSSYEASTGSWRRILDETREIESVSKEDVARVAAKLFDPSNCVAGSTRAA